MLDSITKKLNNIPVFYFFLLLTIINTIFITLAILFYNGIFDIGIYPLSYTGRIYSVEGSLNILSSRLYSTGMILSGIIMLLLTLKFYQENNDEKNLFKLMLFFLAGSGFLIAGFSPDDIRHNFHVLGSSLFVASLWILATNQIYVLKDKVKKINYYLLQIILQIPIFAYAGTYFFSIVPASGYLQKIAFATLCFSLLYTTKNK